MACTIQMIHKADPVLVDRFPFARVLKGNRYLFVAENPDAPGEDSERFIPAPELPHSANQKAFDARLNSQNPNGKHIRLTKGQASQFAPQEVVEEL